MKKERIKIYDPLHPPHLEKNSDFRFVKFEFDCGLNCYEFSIFDGELFLFLHRANLTPTREMNEEYTHSMRMNKELNRNEDWAICKRLEVITTWRNPSKKLKEMKEKTKNKKPTKLSI